MSENEFIDALAKSNQEIEALKNRINALEAKLYYTNLVPDSWIVSESFLKRAFAVLGHHMVASLIISVPLLCIVFAFNN